MATQEFNKRKREEYEMQLFGFHSRAVYTTLKTFLQDRIHTRCKQLCESIHSKYNFEGENAEKLIKIRRKLTRAYYIGLKTHLPTIENCVNKSTNIPTHVLLAVDKVQKNQYTAEQHTTTQLAIQILQQKVKKAKMLNCILNDELATTEDLKNNFQVKSILSNVLRNSNNCPEENSKLDKLIEPYKQLKRKYQDSLGVYNPLHKKRCLNYTPKNIDVECF